MLVAGGLWIAYERVCVRIELTRVARVLGTSVIPHAQRLPDDEWLQLVLGQLTGVKSALGLPGQVPPFSARTLIESTTARSSTRRHPPP